MWLTVSKFSPQAPQENYAPQFLSLDAKTGFFLLLKGLSREIDFNNVDEN
jgi:hypothetical protein